MLFRSNPNFALAHAFLAVPLGFQGLYQEVIESAVRALRLSPSDRNVGLYAWFASANAQFAVGHYAEAVDSARRAIERGPGHLGPHVFLTAALVLRGDMTAAEEAKDALLRLRPGFSLTWMKENLPIQISGELSDRLHKALRRAGIPET